MSYFKAEMRQIRFCWGFALDPTGGAYSTPRPPSWILGVYFLVEGGKGKSRERGGENLAPPKGFVWPHPCSYQVTTDNAGFPIIRNWLLEFGFLEPDLLFVLTQWWMVTTCRSMMRLMSCSSRQTATSTHWMSCSVNCHHTASSVCTPRTSLLLQHQQRTGVL